MAEAVHPDYLYITYCRAEILFSIVKNDEAKKFQLKTLLKDPNKSKYYSPENLVAQKLSRRLMEKVKK
jgi:hypothetical protein